MFSYSVAPEGAPGFAVITDRFVALLDGIVPSSVAEYYDLMSSDEVSIDDLLEAASTRDIQDFAIVELLSASPVAVAIAASGSARVDIDGASSTTIAGPPGATWVIGQAKEIASLVMSIRGFASTTDRLPIARGVVPADSILIDDAAKRVVREEPIRPETMPIVLPKLDAISAVEPPEPTPPTASSTVLVELPDGNRLDPVTPVMVGRRPWTNATDDLSRYHVTAPSPERQISARHILIDSVGDQLVAHDLNSTNGTIVLRFGRPPRLLHDGGSTLVEVGDVLDLGENYRITIVRA